MYEIYKPFPETIIFKRRKYKINLAFDRVISFFELFNNEKALSDEDKFEIACEWFVPKSKKLPKAVKIELFKEVFNNLIVRDKSSGGNAEPKSMDYAQDSAYIYASFMAEYGIDLFEERGRLHWWKFYSLFEGLPSDSQIKRIIDIRTKPVPAANGKNQKEINRLMKLKTYYALKLSDEEKSASVQMGLNKLFNMLERQGKERRVD